MTENIVQIDLAKIDIEISAIENEIAELEAKKSLKIGVKDFLLKNAISKNGGTKTITQSIINGSVQYGGISEFIVKFLEGHPGADTRAVITAYATHMGKKYDDVSNNISNALSRLKDSKIRGEEKDSGGRKAGLNWYKI